jgi:hypothetical protein
MPLLPNQLRRVIRRSSKPVRIEKAVKPLVWASHIHQTSIIKKENTMNPTIQYPGYTVEIPDRLLKPFKVFATVLAGAEFDHPFELFDNPHSARVVDTCLDSVLVAIGKQFAHESTLGDAFNHWCAILRAEGLQVTANDIQRILAGFNGNWWEFLRVLESHVIATEP